MSGAGLLEALRLTRTQIEALMWRYGQTDGELHTLIEAGERFNIDWVALAVVESRLLSNPS
jgi:hypothetical protein